MPHVSASIVGGSASIKSSVVADATRESDGGVEMEKLRHAGSYVPPAPPPTTPLA